MAKQTVTRQADGNERLVIGVGGCGCNMVNRMAKTKTEGLRFIAVNTDRKHLASINNKQIRKVLIGRKTTKGLGAKGDPAIGAQSAKEDARLLRSLVSNERFVAVCAGMGGGTSTCAAPLIARFARESGAYVVSIVTFPFGAERVRAKVALEGIYFLKMVSDQTIVFENDRLVQIMPNAPIEKAFEAMDNLIRDTILFVKPVASQESRKPSKAFKGRCLPNLTVKECLTQ
jgi:cell division protein FtsZ